MLLALDVGNTNITIGVWDKREGGMWRARWRLRTVHEKTVDEYWISLRTLLRDERVFGQIERVILSSVVPPLTHTFTDLARRYLGRHALLVNHETPMNIRVVTDFPAEVGADRIVNAAAAYHLYGGPCVVIDIGTAITFDWISAEAELRGVVIVPGPRVAAEALAQRAAQLSHVALEAPPTVLGRNTVHAVQSGIIFGYVSLVEGMIARLTAEQGVTPTVIGTGGLIYLLTPHTDVVQHVAPWLTLTGLRLINDLN